MSPNGAAGRVEALASDPEKFPGALLLTGPSEAALARESLVLAARLLCPGDDSESSCGSCRRVFAGIHPDLLTIEPEGVQIRVDRVREALAFGAGRPYESARRVVRMLRAEQLGPEAANALLKTLEEPGARLRWILATARPESLLATIRSRCAAVAILAPSRSEREREWRERGLSEDDAADLVVFGCAEDGDPAERLEETRAFRLAALEALEEGVVEGRRAALVMLADACASLDRDDARIVAELLADAAIADASPGSDAIRHRSVAGRLARIARHVRPTALKDAALAAADPPPDIRRGNRRLHYEKVLMELFEGRQTEGGGGRR
jgi:DNA polymerase III delta prime subunit